MSQRLVLQRRIGQVFIIETECGPVRVTVAARDKLWIDAPLAIKIRREEITKR